MESRASTARSSGRARTASPTLTLALLAAAAAPGSAFAAETGRWEAGSEVVSARTEGSRTYRRADGSLRRELSTGPLNYVDRQGRLQRIVTELVPASDGSLVNETNTFVTRLPPTTATPVKVVSSGASVELSWRPAGLAVLVQGRTTCETPPLVASLRRDGKSGASYAETYPNVAERYSIRPGVAEHEIVFTASPAPHDTAAGSVIRLAWDIVVKGGTLAPTQGGLLVAGADGAPALVLPPAFVVKPLEVGSPRETLALAIEKASHGERIHLDIPLEAIAGATPEHPVVVDPTVVDARLDEQDVTVYGAQVASSLTEATSLSFADMDGDGAKDMVFGEVGRRNVLVFMGPQPIGSVFDLRTTTPDMRFHHAGQLLFGAGLACADFSGDGVVDLAVGAPDRVGIPGEARIFFGPFARGADVDSTAADVVIRAGRTEELFALRLLTPDLDGDGSADLVIGNYQSTAAGGGTRGGEAHVLFGPFTSGTVRDLGTTPPDVHVLPLAAPSWQGIGLGMAAADVSGDGIDDLVLGSRAEDRVRVIFGRPRAAWPSLLDPTASPQDVTVSCETCQELGGCVGVGDVSGDGVPDLLIGEQRAQRPGAGGDWGRTHVLFGPLATGTAIDLVTTPADITFLGSHEGDYGPSDLRAGDVDGDTVGDFVIAVDAGDGIDDFGSVGANTVPGDVSVFFGPLTRGTTIDLATDMPDLFVGGTSRDGRMGGVTALGDYSGDGIDDIAMGAHGTDGPLYDRSSAGSVFVVFWAGAGRPCHVQRPDVGFITVTRPAATAPYVRVDAPGTMSTLVNVYAGTIDSLWRDRRYDHGAMPGACSVPPSAIILSPSPGVDAYYLATDTCTDDAGTVEGPLGLAQVGADRPRIPSARVLGRASCP